MAVAPSGAAMVLEFGKEGTPVETLSQWVAGSQDFQLLVLLMDLRSGLAEPNQQLPEMSILFFETGQVIKSIQGAPTASVFRQNRGGIHRNGKRAAFVSAQGKKVPGLGGGLADGTSPWIILGRFFRTGLRPRKLGDQAAL